MLILITKDSATRIPKEVRDLEEAKTFADAGFPVHVATEDGETALADVLAAVDAHVQELPTGEGSSEADVSEHADPTGDVADMQASPAAE